MTKAPTRPKLIARKQREEAYFISIGIVAGIVVGIVEGVIESIELLALACFQAASESSVATPRHEIQYLRIRHAFLPELAAPVGRDNILYQVGYNVKYPGGYISRTDRAQILIIC